MFSNSDEEKYQNPQDKAVKRHSSNTMPQFQRSLHLPWILKFTLNPRKHTQASNIENREIP